ncbi:MAG: NAD(+)/NADH kinase [Chloroflexi bacterium]|nr:NAD(+)/NADH kinase [Chloroflexota bacterium]
MPRPNLVGLVHNPSLPDSRTLVESLVDSLRLRDRSWMSTPAGLAEQEPRFEDTSLVVVAGGDGTILRTIRGVAPFGLPIVGINMGRVGFMSELSVQEAPELLPSYLNGDYRVEERMMLSATVKRTGSTESGHEMHALNDVVVARGRAVRMLDIRTVVDGVPLTTYRADGVIVATPTGSTGYALSAGGSILYPEARLIVVQPIAAHTGLREGVVLPGDSSVELTPGDGGESVLSVDSFSEEVLEDGSTVIVGPSPYVARFLRANPASAFYSAVTRHLGLPSMDR